MKIDLFDKIDEIENKLGYKFKDKNLLLRAFTHSSMLNEGAASDNENLEFLGDSILKFILSSELFKMFDKTHKEGELTNFRKSIEDGKTLIEIANSCHLSQYLSCSDKVENFSSDKYGDLIEAVIASIFLDGGLKNAREFILKIFKNYLSKECLMLRTEKDFKSKLLEFCQKHKKTLKYIELKKDGFAHLPTFSFEVEVDGKVLAREKGTTKKQAQWLCAKKALSILENS